MIVAVVMIVVQIAVVAVSSPLRVRERRSWALATAIVGAVLLPLRRSDLLLRPQRLIHWSAGSLLRRNDFFTGRGALKGWWGHAER